MGRSRRKSQAASLREGTDAEGKKVFLHGVDSYGDQVGFIDADGSAYPSLQERDQSFAEQAIREALRDWLQNELEGNPPRTRDIVLSSVIGEAGDVLPEIYDSFRGDRLQSDEAKLFWLAEAFWKGDKVAGGALRYAQEMRLWQRGGRVEGEPNPEADIRSVASGIWAIVQDQRLRERSLDQYEEMHEPRFPLYVREGLLVFPSRIKGAEIGLQRITETESEKETLRQRLRQLSERLQSEGLGAIPDEILASLNNSPDEEWSIEGVDMSSRPIWQAGWRLDFNSWGDHIMLETSREGVDAARRAGWDLEKAASGVLSDEEVLLRITAASQPPEEAKQMALDILAEGDESEYVRRMKAFGVPEENILREAEKIVLGEKEDRAVQFAETRIFLPQLGEVRVSVSGENKEDILERIKPLLPNADLEE